MPNWSPYVTQEVAHFRKMASAFEEQSERRARKIERLEAALREAEKRIAELSKEPRLCAPLYEIDDPVGELMAARLLITNLRRQLRERPPARKAA